MSPRAEPRSIFRTIRLGRDELARIQFLAHRSGLRVSSFIRAAALTDRSPAPRAPRTGRTRFTEPRSIRRQIRLHPTEDARLRRLAEALNLPPARFIREAAVGYNLRSRADSALIVQLIRLGTNLNQLTRLANQRKQVELTERLAATLARVDAALDELL